MYHGFHHNLSTTPADRERNETGTVSHLSGSGMRTPGESLNPIPAFDGRRRVWRGPVADALSARGGSGEEGVAQRTPLAFYFTLDGTRRMARRAACPRHAWRVCGSGTSIWLPVLKI
jgi:hypothetical protein